MSSQASKTRHPASARSRSDEDRLRLWPLPEGTWVSLAGLLPIFAGHYVYAALSSQTAFTLVMAEAVVLGALLCRATFRRDLSRMDGLILPAIFFAMVIAVGLFQLTPWAPGGPHPVWAYVGQGPGATTIDRSSTVAEIIKLMGLGCIFLVGALTGASDLRARSAVNVLLGLALILTLWAFFGSVTGTVFQTQGRRLEGHFMNPNTAGTFMAAMLVVSVALLSRRLRTASPRDRIARAAPMAAMVLTFAICLLMTASRGATVAAAIGLAIFAALQLFSTKVKVSRALIIGLAALALSILVIYVAGDVVIDRFATSDPDAQTRTAIWAEHWQAFQRSPLLGYGMGTAETVNKTLITPANYPTLWAIKAILNVYLQWLEQTGVLGAGAMFACIGAVILRTVSGALARSRMALVLFGLIAVDAVFIAHGAADFALDTFSMAAMWSYLLGLQLSLSQGSGR